MLTNHDIEIVDAMFQAKRIMLDLAFEVLEQEKKKHKPEERSGHEDGRIEGMLDMIDVLVNGHKEKK